MRGKHLERKTNRWGGRGRDARVGLRTGRKEAAEAGVGQPARGSSGEVPGRPWKSPSTPEHRTADTPASPSTGTFSLGAEAEVGD